MTQPIRESGLGFFPLRIRFLNPAIYKSRKRKSLKGNVMWPGSAR
jgi:hypothetical protein